MSRLDPKSMTVGARFALSIGALGVVFGDIGTSPLYTMKQCRDHLPANVDPTNGVLGILSLMFWALVIVVCLKYLLFVAKADNEGEGGIFALLALLHARKGTVRTDRLHFAVVMILIGAALLYGDGIITPAITVLGAAEGFSEVNPRLTPAVPWIAGAILALLFWAQKKGTKSIGNIFGPVMLVWFIALAALGLWHIRLQPGVLKALNPAYAIPLLHNAPLTVIAGLLGAVVLTITGTEALYADMGHFGRRYIELAWYFVAFPGLVLNYFGQGAYMLQHPGSVENPFFALAPQGTMRSTLTGLSIIAAIIASQALISGAYSLTRQAIQLGYFPRLKITYTNAEHSGQIYVPFVNLLLALGAIATVAAFRSSDNLAAAYGIAVTGTMAITTLAFFMVTQRLWNWPFWFAAPVCSVFLIVDLAFFLSNAHKIEQGGWYPLAIGAIILAVMQTWKSGRQEIYQRVYGNNVTEAELTSIARSKHVTRVNGAAVFMVGSPSGTPIALLHHVKSNRCLHQTVLLLSILTEDVPTVPHDRRLILREIGEGIWRVIGHYGYMESPNVSALMAEVSERGVAINPQAATYFFNREMIITGGNAKMWEWQKRLYAVLSRNASPARDYYNIPPSQIIELGLALQL